MSQPYGYTNYNQPRGSRPFTTSADMLDAHERGETPDVESTENDETNEEGQAPDPLRLAVLRLLMGQRSGGR